MVLRCANSFTVEMVSRPELLALIARKASALVGRNLRAVAEDITAKPAASAGMQQLMDFGRAHSDIVKIKE